MNLIFEPEGHRYILNGKAVPSVTQVLAPLSSFGHVPPDVLRRAAEFGTNVHAAVHLFNMDALDMDALDPALAPYVTAWAQFLKATGSTVIASERRVASESLGCAGTLDSVVFWGKTERIVDIKSGGVPRTVGPQTAAYETLHREEVGGVKRLRHCIQLRGDGTWKNVSLKDPADYSIFMSALNIHHWLAKAA